jgi:hypothetical protein
MFHSLVFKVNVSQSCFTDCASVSVQFGPVVKYNVKYLPVANGSAWANR